MRTGTVKSVIDTLRMYQADAESTRETFAKIGDHIGMAFYASRALAFAHAIELLEDADR